MKRVSALLVSVCLLFLSTAACADDFILKSSVSGTSFDWREGSNYEGDAAPSAGDFVQIPEGVTAKLSAGDAWWDFVSALGRIRPMTATSYFQVDVPAGVTNALACEVTCTAANEKASMGKGGLVKTGLGCLDLKPIGKYTHFTHLTAAEGLLRIMDGATESKCYFDVLSVTKGAVLELMSSKAAVCHSFSGDGEVTSDQGTTLQTFSSDEEFTFDGRMTGSVKLYALNSINLTATNSTTSGALNVATSTNIAEKGGISILGITRFGKRGEAGSVGNPSTWSLGTSTSAAGIRYLGNGETTDRNFALKAVNDGPFVFDGGASGGLTLAGGNVSIEAKDAALNHRIVLCGSNQTACVFADRLIERTNDDVRVAYHLLKRGTGTWRLSDVAYTASQLPWSWSGATSVEEGVLQFDSLAEAGVLCSLGSATNLYSAYTGAPDDAKRVTWAMSLGTPTTAGTLEYVGAADVDCRTRPILMKGDGTLANSTEQAFRFSGVSTEAGSSPTLTLTGTGAGGNIMDGVADTDQDRLSIAKTGAGTWTLSTNVAFHGSLDVCEGRLNVNAGSRYTWFRFTVTENYGDESAAAAKTLYIKRLAFFDKDGISQTVGLAFADDYRTLQPGQFAYGGDYVTRNDKIYPSSTTWEDLFADGSDGYASVALAAVPTAGEPSTAVPIVVRLPEGANPIASFDICYNTSKTGGGRVYQPKAFTLEGSTDGLAWTPLLSKANIVSPGAAYWLASGLALSKAIPWATTPYLDGDEIVAPAVRPNPIASASQVSVAAGATLALESGRTTVSSLKLDIVNGMGTFKGVDFAATGTVELVGEFGHQVPSATLIDCTGFSNVSNWTVTRNNKVISTRLVTTDDGAITVIRPGMVLIFK